MQPLPCTVLHHSLSSPDAYPFPLMHIRAPTQALSCVRSNESQARWQLAVAAMQVLYRANRVYMASFLVCNTRKRIHPRSGTLSWSFEPEITRFGPELSQMLLLSGFVFHACMGMQPTGIPLSARARGQPWKANTAHPRSWGLEGIVCTLALAARSA